MKRELKMRGLLITGNKNELVERLQAAIIGVYFVNDSISYALLTCLFIEFTLKSKFVVPVFSEGEEFDETGISEDLLDEGDDVLNVSVELHRNWLRMQTMNFNFAFDFLNHFFLFVFNYCIF